jgi:hypothetical protein
MMGIGRLEELLRSLGEHGIERARPGLDQEIKGRIPARLTPHRMDTINIIVDLRISRVAAAAVIVLAMLVIGRLVGGRDAVAPQLVEDGKLFLRYTLGGERACKAEFLGNLAQFRDDMRAQGREVVYYGDHVKLNDPCVVIMHWKLPDGRYGVILGDLTTRTVSAKTLITLQDHMLQSRLK